MQRRLVSYKKVRETPTPHIFSADLPLVLGVISERTFLESGIFLSAIVVNARSDHHYPGGGFLGVEGIPSKVHRVSNHYLDRMTDFDKGFIYACQQQVFNWAGRRGVKIKLAA